MKQFRKIQIHFEVYEDQYRTFIEAIRKLRYASMSEYLREKVREAIRESQKATNNGV